MTLKYFSFETIVSGNVLGYKKYYLYLTYLYPLLDTCFTTTRKIRNEKDDFHKTVKSVKTSLKKSKEKNNQRPTYICDRNSLKSIGLI